MWQVFVDFSTGIVHCPRLSGMRLIRCGCCEEKTGEQHTHRGNSRGGRRRDRWGRWEEVGGGGEAG